MGIMNKQEVVNQARELILAKDNPFRIDEIVDDILKVYPASRKAKETIIQLSCEQLAKLVAEQLIEPVDITNIQSGWYKPKGL